MIKKCIYEFIIILLFMYAKCAVIAQNDTTDNCKNSKIYLYVLGSTYALTMVGLYEIWYKDYPTSAFHFFNDADEWLQMDKAGHTFTAYALAKYADAGMRKYCCMKNKTCTFWGVCQSMIFLTTLELFDGFSSQWGFSWSDMGANFMGSSMYAVQELLLAKQTVIPKFSASFSPYSKYRPETLGRTFPERILKDYNGQNYWLSFSPFSFSKKQEIKKKYSFICLSIGYGAAGMLGGKDNPYTNRQGDILPFFKRYRKFLLSLDVDFSKIQTRKKWIKTLFNTINFIKIPFPTIEYSQGKIFMHGVYF